MFVSATKRLSRESFSAERLQGVHYSAYPLFQGFAMFQYQI